MVGMYKVDAEADQCQSSTPVDGQLIVKIVRNLLR